MSFYDIPGNLPNFSIYGGPNYLNLSTPIGSVTCFAGTGSPYGYLLCDGSSVSRDQYSALFSVIGVIYGSGDGTGTFNLPDLQSRVPVGRNLNQSPFTSLGLTGGEITHTLTIPEMPTHNHTGSTDPAGAHTHTLNNNTTVQKTGNNTPSGLDGSANEIDNVVTLSASVNGVGDHTHTFTSTTTGGSQPHNNLQPYVVLNYIIKY